MSYTAEENKELIEYNKKKYCPLSFSGNKIRHCKPLECMLYDDEIHEYALGRKTYLDEEEDDA